MMRRFARRFLAGLALAAMIGLPLACGDQVELGAEDSLQGVGADAGTCVETRCQRSLYACGDCQDNDDDGLIDGADPDCLGPCDNTEDSYYPSIPGQNQAPCVQDCYFDQDTGAGNDNCYWSHECDVLSITPAFAPSGEERCAYAPAASIPGASRTCTQLGLEQPPGCRDFCEPLTPNGCDCFGCCELPAGSGNFVWIGSTQSGSGSCNRDNVTNPDACRPCTPVPSCFNGCSPCEVCVGKVQPATGCPPTQPTEPGQCPEGVQPCGLKNQGPCPSGEYCITGCCIAVPA